jgi:hypothetical protein
LPSNRLAASGDARSARMSAAVRRAMACVPCNSRACNAKRLARLGRKGDKTGRCPLPRRNPTPWFAAGRASGASFCIWKGG